MIDTSKDLKNHIWMPEPDCCIECGQPTHYAELSFEAPLCPGACTEKWWRQLQEDNLKAGPWSHVNDQEIL